jgi:hypothetical protein
MSSTASTTVRTNDVIASLWPSQPSRLDVWAILDGAQDDRIARSLRFGELQHRCLYVGELHPVLEAAAPHLVRLERESRQTRTLIERGWGKNWGVFLRCGASLSELHRHLRGFLRVRDERGRRLIFRYYDPRVLRMYLPTCTPSELDAVFGPIERFAVEADGGESVVEFHRDGPALVERRISLAASQ